MCGGLQCACVKFVCICTCVYSIRTEECACSARACVFVGLKIVRCVGSNPITRRSKEVFIVYSHYFTHMYIVL